MCGRIPSLSEGSIYGSIDDTKVRCFCETTYTVTKSCFLFLLNKKKLVT